MSHLVSEVIITYNKEENIKDCMRSIKVQSYNNIEIIIVDNFLTGDTKEISLKYTDKVINNLI